MKKKILMTFKLTREVNKLTDYSMSYNIYIFIYIKERGKRPPHYYNNNNSCCYCYNQYQKPITTTNDGNVFGFILKYIISVILIL